MASIPTFKCVLVGCGGAGKTAFVMRHLADKFKSKYTPTLGVEVHPLVFNTTSGPICLNIWDTAGTKKYGGLSDGYYLEAQCAIIMFDRTKEPTYSSICSFYERIRNMCGSIPIVLIESKSDLHTDFPFPNLDLTNYLGCYKISSKNGKNLGPFRALIRNLVHKDSFEFVD